MCQLLGMNANVPTDVMFSFTGLATRAEPGQLARHAALQLTVEQMRNIRPESLMHRPEESRARRIPHLAPALHDIPERRGRITRRADQTAYHTAHRRPTANARSKISIPPETNGGMSSLSARPGWFGA